MEVKKTLGIKRTLTTAVDIEENIEEYVELGEHWGVSRTLGREEDIGK